MMAISLSYIQLLKRGYLKLKGENMELPNKASELLRLAINDLELIEKDERYSIDMNTWHIYNNEDNKCAVCLAGSIIAKTLNYNILKLFNFSNFSENIHEKLEALNEFKNGNIIWGLARLNLDYSFMKGELTEPSVDLTKYSENPSLFKQQILDLADIFEAEGV